MCGSDLEAQLEAAVVKITDDVSSMAELERQLESEKKNRQETEDDQNDALASLEETIQALEREKIDVQVWAPDKMDYLPTRWP